MELWFEDSISKILVLAVAHVVDVGVLGPRCHLHLSNRVVNLKSIFLIR